MKKKCVQEHSQELFCKKEKKSEPELKLIDFKEILDGIVDVEIKI